MMTKPICDCWHIKPPSGAPLQKYWAAICKTPADSFVVVFPDLPDCVAFGDSFRSAKMAASIALTDYLEGIERGGDPIPKPSTSHAIRSDPRNEGCYVFCVKAIIKAEQ
jgi:predicted RNase H-like HicB family nuclease